MPTDKDTKEAIQLALNNFQTKDLLTASYEFWNVLGYSSERRYDKTSYSYNEFAANFTSRHTIREDRALKANCKEICLLFQLTDEEILDCISQTSQQTIPGLEDNNIRESNLKSYLFASVELDEGSYTRTQLATLSREINRCFAMPVLLLIKIGSRLNLSVIYRRRNKQDADKDVLEKVTQIKDINLHENAHRAHIEILFDLTLNQLTLKAEKDHKQIHNFDTLHKAWENTLSTDALSNTFYRELRNWYLWTIKSIRFPQTVSEDDLIPDLEHQKISAIRLLTRFMFCWFLKEKQGLVPEALFDPRQLTAILKDFDPLGESANYYQAILQNLFFATLSVPMEDRRFITGEAAKGLNPDYGNPRVFRYHELFRDSSLLEKLFAPIPFLNGGLFDCLDKRTSKENDQEIRLDGFSKKEAKRAYVPNKLFWGKAIIDLSQELGGASFRQTEAHGLISIFANYKFTVEENTPIDEEIALDPTLLGKAFEELLAYYNPETNQAAKNQTGSFYTPPLVSEYMIDKSLRLFLHNALSQKTRMSKADIEVGLDILLSYTEKEHAFSAEETRVLVQAIDECKAIDPACGSGAFLMGILHKLVDILQKLDKDNLLWFDLLIENFPAHLKKEMRIKLREENHSYKRKLGLIQKCIYGVDIQPIAIQIAKLRFFLTLLIEQDIDHARAGDNYNFLPLPNLEFKLICADTLLRFRSELTQNDENQIVLELENPRAKELREAVNDYFAASLPDKKQMIVNRIKDITNDVARIHITEIDKKIGQLRLLTATRRRSQEETIAIISFEKDQWLSYHGIFDNRTVLFFESQFQFPDVQEGFDIVIGNPPYIQLSSVMIRKQTDLYQRMDYTSFERTGDIYCLFYERGLDILKPDGVLCYITSNKWMRSSYGRALRELLQDKSTIHELVDMRGFQVFASATVDTNIITLQKREPETEHKICFINIGEDFSGAQLAEYLQDNASHLKQKDLQPAGWTLADDALLAIKEKMERHGKPLKDWGVNIYYGVKTGCNEAFIIDTEIKERLCQEDPRSAEVLKPILRGKDISRYRYDWAGLWLIKIESGWTNKMRQQKDPEQFVISTYPAIYQYLRYKGEGIKTGIFRVRGKGLYERDDQGDYWWELRDCTYYDEFDKDKIAWPSVGNTEYTLIPSRYLLLDTNYFIVSNDLFLYGLLNSKLITIFINSKDIKIGSQAYRHYKYNFESIPIPMASDKSRIAIESKVKELISLINTCKDDHAISELLVYIDHEVCRLYNLTDEEIKLIEGAYDG